MDRRPGEGDGGVVVGIKGLGNDDLVPIVQNGGEGHLQRLAAAGGGQDLTALQLNADALVVATHRIQKDGHAGRRRIGHDGIVELLERLVEGRRGLHVRLADVQVIDFQSPCLGLGRGGVELAHWGKPAALHFR